MKKIISRDLYLYHSRIVTHVIFWVLYYVIFSLLWSREGNLFASFELEFVLMPIRIAASYLSLYFLIPKFLAKEKVVEFITGYLVLVVVAGVIQRVLTYYFHELFFEREYALLSISMMVRSMVLVNSTVMLLSSLKVYKLWIQEKRVSNQLIEEPLEIRSEKRFYKVFPSDILYLEGLGNYITIYLKNGKSLISYLTLKEAESMLNTNFKRIHKSFVINTREVDSYNNENVEISGRIIPIGKSYEL